MSQLSIILAGEAVDLWLMVGGNADLMQEFSHLEGSIHATHDWHVALDEDEFVERSVGPVLEELQGLHAALAEGDPLLGIVQAKHVEEELDLIKLVLVIVDEHDLFLAAFVRSRHLFLLLIRSNSFLLLALPGRLLLVQDALAVLLASQVL